MICIPFLEVGIAQIGFLLGYILAKGRFVGNIGFCGSLIEILGKDFEAEPVSPTVIAQFVGMSGAQDNVNNVGKLPRICGRALSTYSIPLFGESSPKVSSTTLPPTPN